MSVEELTVVLRRNENCGFGFSLLGHPGLQPIIYDILEDSPAAECGQVEVGDVILSVNESDVSRYNTKEVLKCLRLSSDPVTLKLRRDPFIKSCVQEQLSVECTETAIDSHEFNNYDHQTYYHNNNNHFNNNNNLAMTLNGGSQVDSSGVEKPKFEAYMMTGEHILNLSLLQQTAITQYHKTVDSLWNCRKITGPLKSSPVSQHNYVNCNVDDVSSSSDGDNKEQLNCDNNQMPSPEIANKSAQYESKMPNNDRIVWTYNAPVVTSKCSGHTPSLNYQSSTSLPSASPTSPTSISSSLMSDTMSRVPSLNGINQQNGTSANADLSMSETILSPDYQDMETVDILNNRELLMELSDFSDSDSTLLSDNRQVRRVCRSPSPECRDCDYKIIIQVKAPDKDLRRKSSREFPTTDSGDFYSQGYRELKNNEDEDSLKYCTSSPSEDESDVESLHSFHYSPKAVDIPSAVRLAKRLFMLDGFKKSDVSRHLSKNNEFSRVVAEEYLKYFSFENETLDVSLRKFLKQFCLTGETQERERVLVHFSKRYLDCNPTGPYNSQDAVHTLTCAIMLLNTDLHDTIVGHKMTVSEFIENLTGLNESKDFPKDVLKFLYQSIKSQAIEWPVDVDELAFLTNNQKSEMTENTNKTNLELNKDLLTNVNGNATSFIEYKQGYVMRKCCVGPTGKKIQFHKRRWKMVFCTLRDLILFMHKDEKTYKSVCKKSANPGHNANQVCHVDNNSVRINHALATKADDYTKKQNVLRLQTADRAEYLFQASDAKELVSWIETLNFVAASFSAHPLEPPVSSKNKFERPFLTFTPTKLSLREQLKDHEDQIDRLSAEYENHRKNQPERNAKSRLIHNYYDKEKYYISEINRYQTYARLMRSRLSNYPDFNVSPTDVHESKKHAQVDLSNAISSGAATTSTLTKSNNKNTVVDERNVETCNGGVLSYRLSPVSKSKKR